jgi:hypothetical protein
VLVVTGEDALGSLSLPTLGDTLAVDVVVSVHAATSTTAASMLRNTLARRMDDNGLSQLLSSFAFSD